MSEEKSSNSSGLGMDVLCQFSGHLAHELNNLLTPIIACGQMLKDGLNPEDPQYFCAEQIFEAGERCLALSRKLQIIGSRKSNSQLIDLAALVYEAAKSISVPDDRDVRIDLPEIETGSSEERQVSVDTEQLIFLVTEMVNNAIEFMPNGGAVTLSVSNQQSLEGHEGDGWVCLTVKDEGTGMDEEVQAKMFEPYFSTAKKERDKGLGLTLVYGIVRRAGGVILCDSQPGAGTAFSVYFPRASSVVSE